MFEPPNDHFVMFHDALARMRNPQSFDLARSLVITTHEMERQSVDVGRFMQHLREHGAKIEECNGVVIAY